MTIHRIIFSKTNDCKGQSLIFLPPSPQHFTISSFNMFPISFLFVTFLRELAKPCFSVIHRFENPYLKISLDIASWITNLKWIHNFLLFFAFWGGGLEAKKRLCKGNICFGKNSLLAAESQACNKHVNNLTNEDVFGRSWPLWGCQHCSSYYIFLRNKNNSKIIDKSLYQNCLLIFCSL